MLAHALPTIWLAERATSEAGIVAGLAQLRKLGLAEFGDVLLHLPRGDMPALSRLLPRMPSEDVQRAFDGLAGPASMHEAVTFLRIVTAAFREILRRRPRNIRILDVGCGWGRLMRPLLHVSDPEFLAGIDASQHALEACRAQGVLGRLAAHDWLSETLPLSATRHDLVLVHSALTRLPLRAIDVLMAAMRRTVADDGLLAVTVRPVEYWDQLAARGDLEAAALRADHIRKGMAFRTRQPAGGTAGVERGETTVDLAWFAGRYPDWELRATDRGVDEPQVVLILTPR